jgi:hypothetical protein
MSMPLARLVLLLLIIDLNGCYVANQKAFEQWVRSEIAVGMPIQTALARLSYLRFDCTASAPSDCSRVRQSLLPYSCVERVRAYWAEQTQLVSNVEISQIACAGF